MKTRGQAKPMRLLEAGVKSAWGDKMLHWRLREGQKAFRRLHCIPLCIPHHENEGQRRPNESFSIGAGKT